MFALQWICALTLALVSCLSAQPVKRADHGILAHIDDLQREFIENPNCTDGTSLYSPVAIRDDCLSSALNCTIHELSVLANETECPLEGIENLLHAMKTNPWNITDISSANCTCEMYDQTDVKTFVGNIKDQVQRLSFK